MKRDPKWTGFYVEHAPVNSDTEGPSRTRQEFAEECDINTIMRRYEATGIISHIDQREPMYLDLAGLDVPDLATAMEVLRVAEASFMSLPATVRREFDDDVHSFVAFAENPANVDKMREWGLAKKPDPLPDAIRVEVINPPGTNSNPDPD